MHATLIQHSHQLPTSVGLSQARPNYSVSTTPFIYSNDMGISIWCFLFNKDITNIVVHMCKQHLNSYIHVLIICIHMYIYPYYIICICNV